MMGWIDEIFIWWFAVEILGFISLPIVLKIFKKLPDNGYSVSKPFGLLLFSYISWILAYSPMFDYSVLTLFFSLTLIFIFSSIVVYYDKFNVVNFLKLNKKRILFYEALFLFSFLIFLFIRAQTPDILTLEKFMDFSFINGILKSSDLPPIDPWFSGGKINYYYFGHYIVATLTKMTGLVSYVSYNLAYAMFFALFFVAVFGFGYNLTKKFFFGFTAVLFVLILGNAFAFVHILTFLTPNLGNFLINNLDLEYPLTCCSNPSASFIDNINSFDIWASTRVIPNTINEFPYATFLFGDLHAHYMNFPFQLLALALFLNLFLTNKRGMNIFGQNISEKIINIVACALTIGSLFLINAWEFPTYIIFFGLVLLFNEFLLSKKRDIKILKNIIPTFLLVAALSLALFLPYHLSTFKGEEISFVKERTGIQHYLIIFGVFLFVILSFLILANKKRIIRHKIFIIYGFCGLVGASLIFNFSLLIILIPLLSLSLLHFVETKDKNKNHCFVLILILTGALISLFDDILFIDTRMNTIFKTYLQVWIFFGLASAYSIYHIVKNFKISNLWLIVLIFLISISLIAPIIVTNAHFKSGSFKGPSLDGISYMKDFENGDYEAILWLEENIKGTPIIVEAPGKAFTYSSRISANTGLPTVIGWLNHEFVWRGKWYTDREQDVNTIYNTTDNQQALSLIEKYNVQYVYVGKIEKQSYSSSGLEKFSIFTQNYKIVFDKADARIYEVTSFG